MFGISTGLSLGLNRVRVLCSAAWSISKLSKSHNLVACKWKKGVMLFGSVAPLATGGRADLASSLRSLTPHNAYSFECSVTEHQHITHTHNITQNTNIHMAGDSTLTHKNPLPPEAAASVGDVGWLKTELLESPKWLCL